MLSKARNLFRCLVAAAIFVALAWSNAASGQSGSNREYEIKAGFLYNFINYIDWPGNALPSKETITLGVVGDNPFGPALEPLNGKMVKGRKLVVKKIATIAEA